MLTFRNDIHISKFQTKNFLIDMKFINVFVLFIYVVGIYDYFQEGMPLEVLLNIKFPKVLS